MRTEVLKTWLNGVENEEKAQEKGEEGYEGVTPATASGKRVVVRVVFFFGPFTLIVTLSR